MAEKTTICFLVIEVSNTLGNKHKDRFSGVMSMTAAGLTKQPYFLFSKVR